MVAIERYSIVLIQWVQTTYTVSLFEELGIIRFHYKLDSVYRFRLRRR
jgi:hypothetical protein